MESADKDQARDLIISRGFTDADRDYLLDYYTTVYPQRINEFSEFYWEYYDSPPPGGWNTYSATDAALSRRREEAIAARAMVLETAGRLTEWRARRGGRVPAITAREAASIEAHLSTDAALAMGLSLERWTSMRVQLPLNYSDSLTPVLGGNPWVDNATIAYAFPPGYDPRAAGGRISRRTAHTRSSDGYVLSTVASFTGVDVAARLDDWADWVLNPNTRRPADGSTADLGLLYWTESYFTCRWQLNAEETRNMSLGQGFVGSVLAAAIIAYGLQTLTGGLGTTFLTLFVANFWATLMFVVYTWSPFCGFSWPLPPFGPFYLFAFPPGVAGDFMDLVASLTPATLPWPAGFITMPAGVDVGACAAASSVLQCTTESHFSTAADSLGFLLRDLVPWALDWARDTQSVWAWPPLTWVASRGDVSAFLDYWSTANTADPTLALCAGLTIGGLATLVASLVFLNWLLEAIFAWILPFALTAIAFNALSMAHILYMWARINSGSLSRMAADARAHLRSRWRADATARQKSE